MSLPCDTVAGSCSPASIMPGQAERSVTITLGYGRTRSGRIGNGVGASSYLLRTTDALWFGDGGSRSRRPENMKSWPRSSITTSWKGVTS